MQQIFPLAMSDSRLILNTANGACDKTVLSMEVLDDSGDVLISFEDGEFFRHFYDESKNRKKKQTFEKDHTFEYEYEEFYVGSRLVPFTKKIIEKKRYECSPEETITTTYFCKQGNNGAILTKIRIREKYFDHYERTTENIYDEIGFKVIQSKEVYKDFYAGGITTTFTKYDGMGRIVEEKTDYKEMK